MCGLHFLMLIRFYFKPYHQTQLLIFFPSSSLVTTIYDFWTFLCALLDLDYLTLDHYCADTFSLVFFPVE